jgi:hypothetical protein
MQQHAHNTRLTPEKRQHGGRREGGGRPPEKENQHPNRADAASVAREHLHEQRHSITDYRTQQDELANASGRSWTRHECTLILTHIIGIMLEYDKTPTDVLRFVSSTIRRSYKNLHALWSKWRDERLVYVVDTAGRGAGSAFHLDHAHHVTVDVIFTITEYIREANSTGGCCTSQDVQRCILQQHQLLIPDRTLRSIMTSMGYRYGRGHIIGRMNDAWYIARIRTFLIQYSKAVVEQLQGRCVVVYMDESYVNVNHARKFTWYHPDTPERNDVVRPSGVGKRLVIVHACTQEGWLTVDPAVHNDRSDQLAPSCELIYEAEKGDADYHANMNGSIYMQWLRHRLLPVFAARFPGQKMVLVLDNVVHPALTAVRLNEAAHATWPTSHDLLLSTSDIVTHMRQHNLP